MFETIEKNPLLDFTDLPEFNAIRPDHIEPALDTLLEQNCNVIEQIVNNRETPDWHNLVLPLEEITDRLDRMWSSVSHLNSVKDSHALRKVYDRCLCKFTDYVSELGQNDGLYQKFCQLKDSRQFHNLTSAQKKAVENALLDFQLSGVALASQDKKRYKEISNVLSELSNNFSKNLLDATDSGCLHVTREEDLQGLPESVVSGAKAKAQQEGKSGWLFSLQIPSFVPFMMYCNNQALRRQMYFSYVTRASELGPAGGLFDNADCIVKTLALRKQQAELLGFEDYASYSLQTKMAESAEQVYAFVCDLAKKTLPFAKKEQKALKDYASEYHAMTKINAWDRAWLSEKLRMHKYDISGETLRPYFPLPKVLQGMFEIVRRLFGITIESEPIQHKWHDDVEFFRILDKQGEVRGYFYMDLFSRPRKAGGAWMGDCRGRRCLAKGLQLPVAYLTCNFPVSVGNKPSLLSHDEVTTLFHEFGHGLHHLLTRVEVASVAGINGVPWDAVELPSQLMENWCWQPEALDLISGHYQTGATIPPCLFKKMLAARNFHSALHMQRQLVFSLFDLQIHRAKADIKNIEDVRTILQQVRDKVGVFPEPGFNRFENSFGHIFAGGYAAGYYSYKWAEVLSADAFGLFEEKGIFDEQTGQSFMYNILEKGGSENPMDLFVAFRGRSPTQDALLAHSGLR